MVMVIVWDSSWAKTIGLRGWQAVKANSSTLRAIPSGVRLVRMAPASG
jgi:hypothetical protein